MTQLQKLFLACSLGLGFSALLIVLEAARHRDIWMILQLPGFLAGAAIWGVHSGGRKFEAVMIVINGAIYSILIIAAWKLLRLARKHPVRHQ
jgi:hypothetical protein